MITKIYNLYTFNELNEKAKEKARDWYRQGNVYYFLSEHLEEYLAELLKENKLKCDDFKVFYSLSCCPGDGAMFEGTVYFKSYKATIKQSGYYYHYNSKTIEIESVKTGKDASKEVDQNFNDLYVSICRKLEKAGYDFIESEDSNENVDKNITINEYTFLSDGTRHD